MRNRSFRFHANGSVFSSALLTFAALLASATLSLPSTSFAQQSLANRLVPILDDGANGTVCGNVANVTLRAETCVTGLPAAEADEVAIQFSGNTAAAAGSNATQTTIAQVDAQSMRLAQVRAQAAVLNPMRSGDDGGAGSRVGGFFNSFGAFGNTRLNGEEPGFEYDGGGFTSGLDVRMNDNLVVGGGFGWNRQNTEFDKATSSFDGRSTGGGDLVSDAFVFSGFGSWFDGPLYVDGMLSYTYVEYAAERDMDSPRNGFAATAKSESDAHQLGINLGGGYQFLYQGLSVGPTAQMNYIYTMINSYNERGTALALGYEDQDIESLTTSIGAEVSYPISLSSGVITPHLRLTWEHELMDDPRKIRAAFIFDDSGAGNAITTETKEPDRNYGRLSVGAAAQLKDGLSAFLDYETLIGLAHVEAHKFTLGGRLEF